MALMSYQTSSKRSPLFCLLIGARKLLCFSAQSEERAEGLGSPLEPNQDELIYDLTKILEGVEVQPATRRLILSTATRFFDP